MTECFTNSLALQDWARRRTWYVSDGAYLRSNSPNTELPNCQLTCTILVFTLSAAVYNEDLKEQEVAKW